MNISAVNDFTSMLQYCQEDLFWPIDMDLIDDIDEIIYDIDFADIGIKDETVIAISSLKQVRPIISSQPWGIFALEFDSNHLEVTILRKVISRLVQTCRAKEYKTWQLDHILFFCFWGDKTARTISIVTFESRQDALPTIKPIYCCPSIEDRIVLERFKEKIQCLSWPQNSANESQWISEWKKAFHNSYGQVLRDSKSLTNDLATIALNIAHNIDNALEIEKEDGAIHCLFERFNKAMNIELSTKKFVDMYAQTIVFGIFSACCMNPDCTQFTPQAAVSCIPSTNPLLKDLLQECYIMDSSLQFDELEIQDLITLLNNTDIGAILSDFNRQTSNGKEDPIIYFYENFLDLYEKEQKKRNGVYYTPLPAVDFMVRAVSFFLKNKYNCENGFFDQSVSILDPAAGTGTFIRRIILEIFDEYNKRRNSISWSDYVRESLLLRVFAFEFMMAPYAVAHMKLAMVLKDTHYDFASNDRLQVYLANALERNESEGTGSTDPLIRESLDADKVKHSNIKVIIGNPPYRTNSENKGNWIMQLMNDYKKEPNSNDRLNERNPKVINDDYVKFIRFAQEIISKQEDAIIAYINPHSFTDNLTFRGMRWNLLTCFDEIYILDLHGNVMSREVLDTNERDENIFDIQQGVSINFFIKKSRNKNSLARVFHAEVCGSRKTKYDFLRNNRFEDIMWCELQPEEPNYFFKPRDLNLRNIYEKGVSLSELFPVQIGGIKTHDDDNLISKNRFDTQYDELYEYRPFDMRHINYDLSKVVRHRNEVMKHFVGHVNLGLVIDRQVVTDNWSHIQIVEHLIDNRLHYSRKGIPVVCPLYLYNGDSRTPNINSRFVHVFEEKTGLKFNFEDVLQDDNFSPIDILDYCYAILFSSKYRSHYNQLLKIDFPRVPFPHDREYFRLMCGFGARLRYLHIQKHDISNSLNIDFIGDGNNEVTGIKYDRGNLYINQNQYFTNISERMYDFCYGGYHGLQKWFKDRMHMILSADDIKHIVQVYNIFYNTFEIMEEIDQHIVF